MIVRRNSDEKVNSGFSDLKKMFSAHIQENLVLNRQRSDLDFAKAKKLKELNHNESIFMRKYEKYAAPTSQRRNSIDVGGLRSVSRTRSQTEEDVSSQKAIGRLTVSNDCPYSLDSWNKLVDVDKKFLEENKNNILSDSMGETKEEDAVYLVTPRENNPLLTNREKSTNSVPLRRNTLTPLDVKYDLLVEDTVEEEIMCIQKPKVTKPRRHSLHPLQGKSVLPRLQQRRASVDASMFSFRQNSREQLSEISKSDTDVRRNSDSTEAQESKQMSESIKTLSRRSSLTESVRDSEPKSVLKKRVVEVQVQDTNGKRVPNATIFIHDETRNSQRAETDICLSDDDDAAETNKNHECSEKSTKDSFLPAISLNVSFTASSENKSVKSVSFTEDSVSVDCEQPMRQRSNSEVRANSTEQQSRNRSRHNSVTIGQLKHMVDTHHGATKLRYIAKLAREMEREAGIGPSPPPDENKMYLELQKCRYLRVSTESTKETSDLMN